MPNEICSDLISALALAALRLILNSQNTCQTQALCFQPELCVMVLLTMHSDMHKLQEQSSKQGMRGICVFAACLSVVICTDFARCHH